MTPARRIPPEGDAASGTEQGDRSDHAGRRREPERRPTRGPGGWVQWWDRPAPTDDEALWEAVQRIQARRLQLGVSVTELARRYRTTGARMRRETLSRVLSGKQPTTWPTAERLAQVLDFELADGQRDGPASAGGDGDR